MGLRLRQGEIPLSARSNFHSLPAPFNLMLSEVLRARRASTAGLSPLSTPDSILMCYQKQLPRTCGRAAGLSSMKEHNAMSLLQTTCPECHAPEVLYSTGVIHNTLFKDITSPVVRCGRCQADFFALPPAILHAALDETFFCAFLATGNRYTLDASPSTCTALKV